MLKILLGLWQVLKVGHELARPEAWKNVQTVASLLAAVLGLAWAMGYPINLVPDDLLALAGVIVAMVNAYLVIATSKRVGLPNADLGPIDLQGIPTPMAPVAGADAADGGLAERVCVSPDRPSEPAEYRSGFADR